MSFTYSGDGDRYEDDNTGGYNDGTNGVQRNERLNIDEAKEDLILMVVGRGDFRAKTEWDSMPQPTQELPPPPPPYSEGVDIVTSATFGDKVDKVTIPTAPSDSTSLGLDDVELNPIEKAREALSKLQEAMNQVDGYRGKYGALQNRFESAIENLATQTVNTAAAQSRIMDADYAKEASAMVKSQILQQAGHSMLSQANQLPQSVLGLLESS